jgi:hypothetical protein
VPFLNVSVCAIVQQGRLPELYPFQGYLHGFRAICRAEGPLGLFAVGPLNS